MFGDAKVHYIPISAKRTALTTGNEAVNKLLLLL